jgi:hypothetical protein
MSLFLGLALGLIGIDPLTGTARFSLGLPQLLDGIDVMILVIGLFAVGETLFQVLRRQGPATVLAVNDAGGMTGDDWRRSWKPWLRGTAVGFPLGVLPCGGAEIPTFLSYMIEKRLSARPEEFGRGAIEGVAGPEAANNAAAAGVLVPLLTLGLPASATAAVLLSAFQQYGLQPGPLLFTARPDLVWTLIASLYSGNVMLRVLNLPLAHVARRLQPQSLVARPGAALWSRRRWLHDAHSRHSPGASGARPDSRADGGAAFPSRRRDRRRRLHRIPNAAVVCITVAGGAARAAGSAVVASRLKTRTRPRVTVGGLLNPAPAAHSFMGSYA